MCFSSKIDNFIYTFGESKIELTKKDYFLSTKSGELFWNGTIWPYDAKKRKRLIITWCQPHAESLTPYYAWCSCGSQTLISADDATEQSREKKQ